MRLALALLFSMTFFTMIFPIEIVFADSIQHRPTPSLKIKALPIHSYNTATSVVSHEIKYLKSQYRKIRLDLADLTEVRAANAYIFVELERKINGTFHSVGHFKVMGGNAHHVEFDREKDGPLVDQATYRMRISVHKNMNHKMHGRYAIYMDDPIHASLPPTSSIAVEPNPKAVKKESPVIEPKPPKEEKVDLPKPKKEPEKKSVLNLPFQYQLTYNQDQMEASQSYHLLKPGEVIQIQVEDTSTNHNLPANALIQVQLQRKESQKWTNVYEAQVSKGEMFAQTIRREKDGNLQDGELYRVILTSMNNENLVMTGYYQIEYVNGKRENVKEQLPKEKQSLVNKKTKNEFLYSYQLTYATDVDNAPYIVPGQPLQTLKSGQVIVLEAKDTTQHPNPPYHAHILAELQRRTLFGWKTVGSTKIPIQSSYTKHVFQNEQEGNLQDGEAYRVVLRPQNNMDITMTGQYSVKFVMGHRKQVEQETSDSTSQIVPKKTLAPSVMRKFP